MAFELNPVAVSAAPLLRAIRAGGWASRTELAVLAGRDPKNVSRDLGVLQKDGLIQSSPHDSDRPVALTAAAEDQLAALDRAENPTAGLGVTEAYHADLVPDPDQPRKDFSSAKAVAELEELGNSITARGRILQPIVVRAIADEPNRFLITDGERRWRTVGHLIASDLWPADRPLPITIQETDGKETKLAQLTANMVRADMTPLEECDAFDDLTVNHAMTTAEIAAQIGKTQKLVQNRLRLRQLSADDRARMSLPEDHPDHLVYKAALKSLMTPREQAEEGGDESGSPEPAPTSASAPTPAPAADPVDAFAAGLSDRDALTLVEIADKAERQPAPDPDLASESYTLASAGGMHGAAQPLVSRGLIGFRQRGLTVYVRPRLYSTAYGAWLKAQGFDDPEERARLLMELRTRVFGLARAVDLDGSDDFATPWLNPDFTAPQAEKGDTYTRPRNVGLAIPPAPMSDADYDAREAAHVATMERQLSQLSDDQPALIEETAEERAARQAAERETAARARDQETAYRFAEEIVRAMAEARAGSKQFGDVFASDTCAPDDFVQSAFGALAIADGPLAGAALAHLMRRAGAMGALGALRAIMIPTVPDTMMFARVAQSRPLDDGDAEPDPVEDFIQAELPEGEDEHDTSEAPAAEAPPVPAVPIRKSIHPDYIVCLEDGRRFKSLKRHLRTRYDLSPAEYIARWGLPRDYPMVAPNYAKARADLARQMGLSEDDAQAASARVASDSAQESAA